MKILSHFAHGNYQTNLCEISPDIEFYHVVDPDAVKFRPDAKPTRFWSEDAPQPRNLFLIEAKDVDPNEFDLSLVHWHPFIDQFRDLWPSLPQLMLEHTWPYKNLDSEVNRWAEVRRYYCDHTVFITPSSQKAWGGGTPQSLFSSSYIYHCFDVDNFPHKTEYGPPRNQVMTTTNEFISRDWACGFSLWAQVLGIPGKSFFEDVALYGYGNANIGKVSKGRRTRQEILELLQEAGVYFNPSIMSPIPMSLLEAAAVGTPIVSTSYCEPGTIFENNVHGVITNDPVELRQGIKELLTNPEKAKEMALRAQSVVRELFTPEKFNQAWLNLFTQYARGNYVRKSNRPGN